MTSHNMISNSVFDNTNSRMTKIAGSACNSQQVDGNPEKIICVCNEQKCDDLKFDWPQESGQVFVVQTSQAGERFKVYDLYGNQSDLVEKVEDKSTTNKFVRVDLSIEHQSVLGWGGAFTDATGENLRSLPKQLADRIIEDYYGHDGLEYNFGRVPLGGSDFSSRAYSYDDTDKPDYELEHWSLTDEDKNYKIPYIKQAQEVANKSGVDLKLFASPWSPPKWMKKNKSFVRGHLINDDKIYKSYANYLMKFYEAYKEHGIEYWGATVQNEPIAAYLPFYFFNSLQFSNGEIIKFISKYLGPALEARGMTKDKFKLMVGDDSLGFVNLQIPAILEDPDVQKYVSGVAFHWYTSGSIVSYNKLASLYDSIKDKVEFMIMSEACTGSQPMDKKVDLGSWDRGQAYADDIMQDLLRQTSAWIDWNMVLDLSGGPNWSKNFVDSPILVNSEKKEYYKQPMYYALAHFSKFFKPGSIRVETETIGKKRMFRSRSKSSKYLQAVAVHNKNTGHLIINLLNKSNNKTTVELTIDGMENYVHSYKLKPIIVAGKSINSIVLKL